MKHLLIIFYFVVSLPLAADDQRFDFDASAIEDRSEEKVVTQQERALHNDTPLRDIDENLGIQTSSYYTGRDSSIFNAAYLMSSNYEHFTEHVTVQAQFLKRTESFDDWWWGFQFQQTASTYEAIADQMDNASVPRNTTTQSFSMVGLGLSHRFLLAKTLFNSDHIFEDIRIFVNAIQHKDSATEAIYQGMGFTSEYALMVRSGKSFYWATKLSYNLAEVSYQSTNTNNYDSDFVFGWLSIGLEVGIVFQ